MHAYQTFLHYMSTPRIFFYILVIMNLLMLILLALLSTQRHYLLFCVLMSNALHLHHRCHHHHHASSSFSSLPEKSESLILLSLSQVFTPPILSYVMFFLGENYMKTRKKNFKLILIVIVRMIFILVYKKYFLFTFP